MHFRLLLNDCGDGPCSYKQEPSKYRRHEEKCLFQLAEIKQSVKRAGRRYWRSGGNWCRFARPCLFPRVSRNVKHSPAAISHRGSANQNLTSVQLASLREWGSRFNWTHPLSPMWSRLRPLPNSMPFIWLYNRDDLRFRPEPDTAYWNKGIGARNSQSGCITLPWVTQLHPL